MRNFCGKTPIKHSVVEKLGRSCWPFLAYIFFSSVIADRKDFANVNLLENNFVVARKNTNVVGLFQVEFGSNPGPFRPILRTFQARFFSLFGRK